MTFAQSDQNLNDARTVRTRFVARLLLLVFCMVTVGSTGCKMTSRFVDTYRKKGFPEKAFEGYRDHVWAKRAYNLRYGNCNISNEEDFRAGFVEGYCDMCEGGTGTPPAIPPNEYWGHRYQSDNGKQAVQSWFKGFPEGVRAAKQDGAGKHKRIFISNEMKEAIALQEKKNRSTLTYKDLKPTESKRQFPAIAESESEDKIARAEKSILVSNDRQPLDASSERPVASTASVPKSLLGPGRLDAWQGNVEMQDIEMQGHVETDRDRPMPMPTTAPIDHLPAMIPSWNGAPPTTASVTPLAPAIRRPAPDRSLPRIIRADQYVPQTNTQMPTQIQQPGNTMPQNVVPIIKPGDLIPGEQLDEQSQLQRRPDQSNEAPKLFQVMPASWQSEEAKK